jgi:hypothetical protein
MGAPRTGTAAATDDNTFESLNPRRSINPRVFLLLPMFAMMIWDEN